MASPSVVKIKQVSSRQHSVPVFCSVVGREGCDGDPQSIVAGSYFRE